MKAIQRPHILGFSVTFGTLLILQFISLFLIQALGTTIATVEIFLLASIFAVIIGGLVSPKYRQFAEGALIGWLLIILPLLYIFGTVLLTGDLM